MDAALETEVRRIAREEAERALAARDAEARSARESFAQTLKEIGEGTFLPDRQRIRTQKGERA